MHFVLNLREIIRSDGLSLRQNKIIVRAILDLRSDRILHILTIELDHSLRKNMREGMTIHL